MEEWSISSNILQKNDYDLRVQEEMLTEEERKIVLQENKLTGVKNSCNQSTNTLGSIRKF